MDRQTALNACRRMANESASVKSFFRPRYDSEGEVISTASNLLVYRGASRETANWAATQVAQERGF